MLHQFSATHTDLFPGGIYYFDFWSASQAWSAVDDVPHAFPLPPSISKNKKSLVVFDEVPVSKLGFVKALLKSLAQYPKASIIFASELEPRDLPSDIRLIRLGGLDREHWHAALTNLDPTLSDEAISEFYKYFGGNPSALELFSDRLLSEQTDSRNLIERLSPFKEIGILGPDGLPYSPKKIALPEQIVEVCTHLEENLFEAITKDPDLMYNISPREFELLVAELLHRDGYEVEVTPASKDGGIDIYAARSDTLGRVLFLVECKKYALSNRVKVDVVRALYGNVSAKKATAGVLVTTSTFTRGAKQFQQAIPNQLSLRDYINLKDWLQRTRSTPS